MPSPGSTVLLKDGRYAVVTKVTPNGKQDRVGIVNGNAPFVWVTAWDIAKVIDEQSSVSNTESQP